jgi:hypothetical protein
VLDYLLFRLNGSNRLDYVEYLNLSGPTDDIDQLLDTLLDGNPSQTDRKHLVLRLLNQWRRGEFGRMILDDIPESTLQQSAIF